MTRRAVVAGTLAGLAGCADSTRRGVASLTVFNPRPEPVSASITVCEKPETTVTVPANGSFELSNRIVMGQTVDVAVTADGVTGSTEWTVDGSLSASTRPSAITFTREAERDTPRELADDGTVDVAVRGDEDTEVTVRVTTTDTTAFERTRRVPDATRIVYHDRIETGGSAVVTVTGDDRLRESVSLANAVSLVVNVGDSVFVDLNRAISATE